MKTNLLIALFCVVLLSVAFVIGRSPKSVQSGGATGSSQEKTAYFASLIETKAEYDLMVWILLPFEYCGRCWLQDDRLIELIYSIPDRKIGVGIIADTRHEYNVSTMVKNDVVLKRDIRDEYGRSAFYIYADHEGKVFHLHENTFSDYEEGIANLRMLYTFIKLHGYEAGDVQDDL